MVAPRSSGDNGAMAKEKRTTNVKLSSAAVVVVAVVVGSPAAESLLLLLPLIPLLVEGVVVPAVLPMSGFGMDKMAHRANAEWDATLIINAKWEESLDVFCSPSSFGLEEDDEDAEEDDGPPVEVKLSPLACVEDDRW